LLAQAGQIPAVVDMGMGEQDPVNPGRIHGEGVPVFQPVVLEPLEKAAVDKQLSSVNLQQKT